MGTRLFLLLYLSRAKYTRVGLTNNYFIVVREETIFVFKGSTQSVPLRECRLPHATEKGGRRPTDRLLLRGLGSS